MQLDWLGEHRNFIEKAIKFANAYAATYQKEQNFGTPVAFSSAQLQTLEYILENEEKNQSMAEIAERLGISRSAFSKNAKKMLEKGLLEKYHSSDNKKNIIIQASDLGRAVYEGYSRYVEQGLLSQMYTVLDGVPPEYICKFADALDIWADDLNRQPTSPARKTLIKIETNAK